MVIFSKQVLDRIDDYAISLTYYPISIDRAIEKVEKLKFALNSLGTSLRVPPICMHKDLGQTFNALKQPLNKNLRRFDYKDESGFQWAFACLYDEENDTITIVKMMPSNQIREQIETETRHIMEFWKRFNKVI